MALLQRINTEILSPALSALPAKFDSPEARVMLLAIGLQESRFEARDQIDPKNLPGPAMGFWQFERGGGVTGVLSNPASSKLANAACVRANVIAAPKPVWLALATDDVLAATFARLLLWTDAAPLPRLGDGNAAWDYYIRNWRPGKPHRRTWNGLYAQAQQAVEA